MTDLAGVGGQVSRGREEDARHVHQLGEGEVDEKRAHERQVDDEHAVEVEIGNDRREVGEAHDEDLDLGDLGLVKVAQAQSCHDDAEQQEEGKVVVGKGDVAQPFVTDAACQQEEDGNQQQPACENLPPPGTVSRRDIAQQHPQQHSGADQALRSGDEIF